MVRFEVSRDGHMMNDESVNELFLSYKESLIKSLNSIDLKALDKLISEIESMSKSGATLYILGNGGSAATASHFVNDLFSLKLRFNNFNLNAESLTDNVSIVTSIGNDISYDDVFKQQLKAKMKKGDALLILSASGNSSNLVNACLWARENNYKIFSILGFDGGKVLNLSHTSLHLQTKQGEYERAEDLHLFVNHFIRLYFQKSLISNGSTL
ncbi:MAG: sugar isomerase [Halobacteriovoraceae bacterium]|nr:sugar isomerase [Halobacteriovoraceae bacterium]